MKISVKIFFLILSPMNGTSDEEHCLMCVDKIDFKKFQ
jgi:hypothetical protein